MAKITKIDVSEYQGKKSYKFTLDNGQTGYSASDSDRKPWDYKEGESITVVKTEVKKGKKGDYNNFTFKVGGNTTQSTPTPQNAPQVAKTPNDRYFAELKFQLRRDVIKTIGEVAAAGRIEPKEMKEYYIDFCVATDSSIDDLKG